MSYNTVFQFRSYSITSGSFDAVPDPVVQTYLDVAQAEIDSAVVIHHTLPFASGSVPASVLEAERVICAFRLWYTMGFNPGDQNSFLERRYQEIVGTPDNPATGWLGQLANGTRALVDPKNSDQEDTVAKPGFLVLGGAPRGWNSSCGATTVFPGGSGTVIE